MGMSAHLCVGGAKIQNVDTAESYGRGALPRTWKIGTDGTITYDVDCSQYKVANLAISMIEDDDIDTMKQSGTSISIVNPATGMALGVQGTSCDAGTRIELQTYDSENDRQKFRLVKSGDKKVIIESKACSVQQSRFLAAKVTTSDLTISDLKLQNEWGVQAYLHSNCIQDCNPYLHKWTVGSSVINIDDTVRINGGLVDFLAALALDDSIFPPTDNTLHFQPEEEKWSQKWALLSHEAVLLNANGSPYQEWEAHFVDAPYNYALLPGFPGDVENGCLSSASDRGLAKAAMHQCDKSMSLLVGRQMSLGTLRAIADLVEEKGPDYMPGKCCFDSPTNSDQYFGIEYDPHLMNCANPGPFHLGISEEACENAGGKWFRTPCVTLKETIDSRPPRFDFENPIDGTCQDAFGRLETAYVSTSISISAHLTVCGSSYTPCGGTSIASDDQELHEVKCCADSETSPGTGWRKNDACIGAGFTNVWGASTINGVCYGDGAGQGGAQDYDQAKTICEGAGARLCTSEELLADCAAGTGCNHDLDMIWSSTPTRESLCLQFCQSLPDYSSQTGMIKHQTGDAFGCTCLYQNGKLPSRELLPSHATPSPPKFTLTNSNGMALGLRPNVDCNANDADLSIEAQVSNVNNPRQQFQLTHDGKFVSVRCPERALTMALDESGGVSSRVGLQVSNPFPEYGYVKVSLSGTGKVLSLAEVQVFALVDGVETDVALSTRGATADQSTTSSSYPADKAIDGTTSGMSDSDITHTNEQVNPWWMVELDQSYVITQIVVWNRQNCCSERLSGAVVSLLDSNEFVQKQFSIGDATNKASFTFTVGNEISPLPCIISGYFVDNETNKYGKDGVKDATEPMVPKQVDANTYVFGASQGGVFKMRAVDDGGTLRDSRAISTDILSDLNELTLDIWNQANIDPNQNFYNVIGIDVGLCQSQSDSYSDGQWNLGDQLAIVQTSSTNAPPSQLQSWQWTINTTDGSISNVANPNLAIASSKEKDVSLSSIYFALQNPRTQLAIGVDVSSSNSCTDGMPIKLQELAYGSPNQQFMYLEDENKIVSLMCPSYAIKIPDGDCETKDGLYLSNSTQNDDSRNEWTFIESVIQSVMCPDKFITIGGASNGGTRRVTLPAQFASGLPSAPSSDNNTHPEDRNYTQADNYTSTLEWDDKIPPTVGSSIVLGSLSSKRYQKWTKEHQLFHPLMGPFSPVNPTNGLAIAVQGGVCSNGMGLEALTDDHTNTRQIFYLGQHGSIFSLECPGLVLSVDPTKSTGTGFDYTIKLQPFRLGQDNLKWKFSQGMIESVMHPGMVISNNTNGEMIVENKAANADPNQTWKRVNTRLLDMNSDQTTWKQEWTLSFVTPGYANTTLEKLRELSNGDSTTCYPPNPAFSASFDDFAKGLIIEDASDEDQCRQTREGMGFDKDHPFDTEIRDKFHEFQCDPFFTGIDHMAEPLAEPPQFEMVEHIPVEYEAVEYEAAEYKTVDYEEFTKDDDGNELKVVGWPDYTEYKPDKGLGNLTGVFTDNGGAADQENLVEMQRTWLNLGHTLTAAEHIYQMTLDVAEAGCKATGPENACAGVGCVTNVIRVVCDGLSGIIVISAYIVLLAVTIAYQVYDDMYEIATMSDKEAYYTYYYARAAYFNTLGHNEWNVLALEAIRTNMKDQHVEMKKQLQERHKDIANHVGEDISDAQNALGQAIVDSQNGLGQSIIDSQNAVGQSIVDARNANNQAIVDAQNYITLQHNTLSEWLHGNLCLIYEALNGRCTSFIGPLEEDQVYIPVEFHWPEGQPTMVERLEQIQSTLSLGAPDVATDVSNRIIGAKSIAEVGTKARDLGLGATEEHVNVVESKADVLEGKFESHSADLQGKFDSLSADLQAKVDAVESKVDAVESKVDAVESKVDAVHEMMTKLMEALQRNE